MSVATPHVRPNHRMREARSLCRRAGELKQWEIVGGQRELAVEKDFFSYLCQTHPAGKGRQIVKLRDVETILENRRKGAGKVTLSMSSAHIAPRRRMS